MRIVSAINGLLKCASELRNSNPVSGLPTELSVKTNNLHDEIVNAIERFHETIGPIWGPRSMQEARQKFREAAYSFAVASGQFMKRAYLRRLETAPHFSALRESANSAPVRLKKKPPHQAGAKAPSQTGKATTAPTFARELA